MAAIEWTKGTVDGKIIEPILNSAPKNALNLAHAMAHTEAHFPNIVFDKSTGYIKVAKGARKVVGLHCTVDGIAMDAYAYRVGSEHALMIPACLFDPAHARFNVCLNDGTVWTVSETREVRPAEYATPTPKAAAKKKEAAAASPKPRTVIPAAAVPMIAAVKDGEIVTTQPAVAPRRLVKIYG